MQEFTQTNQNIYRFEYEEYYVDIVERKDGFESWLLKKGYSVASMMFDLSKEACDEVVTFGKFISKVKSNLEEYIEIYEKEYCC